MTWPLGNFEPFAVYHRIINNPARVCSVHTSGTESVLVCAFSDLQFSDIDAHGAERDLPPWKCSAIFEIIPN